MLNEQQKQTEGNVRAMCVCVFNCVICGFMCVLQGSEAPVKAVFVSMGVNGWIYR